MMERYKTWYRASIFIVSSFNLAIIVNEHFENTKWLIRCRKSKKDRQYNGQKKGVKTMEKTLHNDEEKTTEKKTKDWATRTQLTTTMANICEPEG